MQKLQMISVVLLTIFLSGCQSRPDVLNTYQRTIYFEYVVIDGKKYIDPDLSVCLVRTYQYSLEHLGPINEFQEVPLVLCDKMIGHNPKEYIEVHSFLDDIRREIQSNEE